MTDLQLEILKKLSTKDILDCTFKIYDLYSQQKLAREYRDIINWILKELGKDI